MNWDDLRVFLALSRGKTVSAAGRELGVKHTTVGRRIKVLEAELGTRLFERLREGHELTQAGENLLELALQMEEQAQAIDRQISGKDTELCGELRITAASESLSRIVAPELPRFRASYPGIELKLMATVELSNLAAREADIALRATANPPDYLIGRKVLPFAQGIYASEEYLHQNPKPKHIVGWLASEEPDWQQRYFPGSDVVLESNTTQLTIACLLRHMGVARLPCFLGDSTPDLLRYPVELPPPDWHFWVLSHVDLRTTARVRAGREFLIDVMEQQRDLVEGNESNFFQP